jgi:hypothetical protein
MSWKWINLDFLKPVANLTNLKVDSSCEENYGQAPVYFFEKLLRVFNFPDTLNLNGVEKAVTHNVDLYF